MVDSTTIVAVREERDRLSKLKRHLEIYHSHQIRGSSEKSRYADLIKEVSKAQSRLEWCCQIIDNSSDIEIVSISAK